MLSVPETILSRINSLIVVVSPKGEIEYVNPAVKELLGYEPLLLLGNGWWNLTRRSREDARMARSETMKLRRNSSSFERKLFTSVGEEKWIHFNTSLGPGGRIIGIGYDITERKFAEQQLKERNAQLEKRNEEMMESIRYASGIQQAMLPSSSLVTSFAGGGAVFFRPRDVVGGDFFWLRENESEAWAAVGDSTGHGVPGAMLSVMGVKLLRDAVKKKGMKDPSEVLRVMDKELLESLSMAGPEATPDGMDISLLRYARAEQTIYFSGAFRPLWLVREGELFEFSGNRFPLGQYKASVKNFATTVIPVQKGDQFFLFSDGFPDQFGGEENRKFNRKRFRELIRVVSSLQPEETEGYLDYVLKNWKQETEQTDDISLLTFRI